MVLARVSIGVALHWGFFSDVYKLFLRVRAPAVSVSVLGAPRPWRTANTQTLKQNLQFAVFKNAGFDSGSLMLRRLDSLCFDRRPAPVVRLKDNHMFPQRPRNC